MNAYFGPELMRKEWETQVPTPVGSFCGLCEEMIEDGDAGTMQGFVTSEGSSVQPVHYECQMRSVIGSAAHVQGICSCNIPGSTEGDDPSLSPRRAAQAAVAAWNRTHP